MAAATSRAPLTGADAELRGIGHAETLPVRRDDRPLLRFARIVQRLLEQEAVELRFGQRIRALLLDRILGRHDHEAVAQQMGLGHRA